MAKFNEANTKKIIAEVLTSGRIKVVVGPKGFTVIADTVLAILAAVAVVYLIV